MRVLVCGSREWADHLVVHHVLNGYFLASVDSGFVLIEGGAKGADACAEAWASVAPRSVEHLQYRPDYKRYPKHYAPLARNQQMLDEGKPDVVIAFKDGFQRDPDPVIFRAGSDSWQPALPRGGTEDMVRRAKAAGIPVYIVSHG